MNTPRYHSDEPARSVRPTPLLTVPPPGWDTRDARGRLPGIDAGWDYAPGASVLCVDALAAGGKRRCADTQLLDGLLAKLPGKPALLGAQMVDAWPAHLFDVLTARFAERVDRIANARQSSGGMIIVGALREKWVLRLQALGVTPSSAEIAVRDEDILHAHRDEKSGKLDFSWYRKLPLYLRGNPLVLLDRTQGNASRHALILIYSADENRKLVVRYDYRVKGDDRRVNLVRTGRTISKMDYRSIVNQIGNGFDIIDGNP